MSVLSFYVCISNPIAWNRAAKLRRQSSTTKFEGATHTKPPFQSSVFALILEKKKVQF